jgi:hypothetical protein
MTKQANNSRIEPGATQAIGMKRVTPGGLHKGIDANRKFASFKNELKSIYNVRDLD